ncbi:hypothetical protein VHEMI04575 [[Torrubiella] hemipterigena]|uniref:Uncharacterized protein n=1 Tax=[Torrubiella] hemipterigena TaxID=1531966 RepID=A0A0A1TGQ2_9HYPO|nr:hypothetical protein VHEMI04575 [[Torrubiella] hemipterigena]
MRLGLIPRAELEDLGVETAELEALGVELEALEAELDEAAGELGVIMDEDELGEDMALLLVVDEAALELCVDFLIIDEDEAMLELGVDLLAIEDDAENEDDETELEDATELDFPGVGVTIYIILISKSPVWATATPASAVTSKPT